MRRLKCILPALLAALMLMIVPFAACTVDEGEPVLDSIELDTSNATTALFLGDEFTTGGLVVNAKLKRANSGAIETRDVTSAAVIDHSAYDAMTESGNCDIKVSYTLNSVTKEESYRLTVLTEKKEGLAVSLSAGVADTINLTAESKTASIDVTKIDVKKVDILGNVTEENVTGYTVELYNGDTKVEAPYTGLGEGTYQIWATKKADLVTDYDLTGFALIYVVDSLANFEFVGGNTQQEMGIDTISSTWTYKATYATGKEVPLTSKDVSVGALSTMSATTSARQATVTYTYVNAKGVEEVKSVKVPYTVVQGNKTRDRYSYAWSEISGKSDGAAMTQAEIDSDCGGKPFLTVVEGGTVNYRKTSSVECIEIRYDALKVTFNGVGTLAIAARSTSNANHSSIGVKGEDGKYLSATSDATTTVEMTYPEGKMYDVTGNVATITFTITKPGTYTIFTNDIDPDDNALFLRTTRITGIEMSDVRDSGANSAAVNTIGSVKEITLYADTKALKG